MKKIVFILVICLSVLVYADNVKVRIYAESNIKEASFGVSFGSYTLEGKTLKKQDKLKVNIQEGKVALYINDELISKKDTIKMISEDLKCFFSVTPAGLKQRRYDNNLEVCLTKDKKNLMLINSVEVENYIAGVVQSEAGGASDNVEFFKVQAICCRTYMMRNLNKHKKERPVFTSNSILRLSPKSASLLSPFTLSFTPSFTITSLIANTLGAR